jgi:hypothetical protein
VEGNTRISSIPCLVAICGFSIFATAVGVAGQNEVTDIEGTYKQAGGNLICTIKKTGEVYRVHWKGPGNQEHWIGVGTLHDRTFSTCWAKRKGGDLALAIYRVEKGERGPRLVGWYASFGDEKKTPDKLHFISK